MVMSEQQVDLSILPLLAREYRDEGYARFVCKVPFSFYLERIKRIGFEGKESVIDVGCGFGQWSAALALLNKRVVALEQNPSRLSIARALIRKSGLSNVEFALGDALALLDREDGAFDAVFCYGVFMFLDREKALGEFWRVLKPGGELYICTNAFGWWLRLWLQHLFGDRHVRQAAYRAMRSGHRGGLPNSTNRRDIPGLLKSDDWEALEVGYEGTVTRSPERAEALPVYRGSFLGLDSVIEFLARKKPVERSRSRSGSRGEQRTQALQGVLQSVRRTQRKSTYDYVTPLAELPQPHPARDLVNNCSAETVKEALELSRATNRVELLQRIYQTLTAGQESDLARVQACLRFAQLHFFHHFAGQPMQAKDLSVLDPIASVLLRSGRCGTVARFLVDLFECNEHRARLLTAACHTVAEVWCNGRWILLDASLYPPGVGPRDDTGGLVTIDQVVDAPSLLDRCPSYINYHHEYIDAFLSAYPETASTMEAYLRTPLVPSSAYFGDAYYDGRQAGQVERLAKRGTPREWNADANFGWLLGYERCVIQGPVLRARQRPGQVTKVCVKSGRLEWEWPAVAHADLTLVYHLRVSDRSRGWQYHGLPIGCDFSAPGQSVRTTESLLDARSVKSLGRYLTISAEVQAWQAEDIFYLPSREFDLEDVQ